MRVRTLILGLVLLTVCAGGAHAQEKAKEKKPVKERNLITVAEIEKSGVQDLHQAVRRLRPAWLSSRGAAYVGPVLITKDVAMVIYVDGARRGGLVELELIPISQVKELRYLPMDQAVSRFGGDHPFGAIEVSTKK